MDRPEYSSHATTADALEDLVLVEKEIVGVPLPHHAGLIAGDVTRAHQPLEESRHLDRIGAGRRLPALIHVPHLVRRHEPAADEKSADIFHRKRHAAPPTA